MMGAAPVQKPVLVRLHSECMTGDVFSSLRCDCGDQLDAAELLPADVPVVKALRHHH